MDTQQSLEMSLVPFTKTMKAIENLQGILNCKICEKQPISPISMGRCDHFFCELCISNSLHNCCPICKIPSLPCERNPDNIVSSLVSSCTDLITLFNGGKLEKKPQGLEAPDSAYPFSSPKSDKKGTKSSITKENNKLCNISSVKSSTLRAASKKVITSKSASSLSSKTTSRPRGVSLRNSFRNLKSINPKNQENVTNFEDGTTSLESNKLDLPTSPSNMTCPKKQEFKTQMTPAVITSLASNKLNLPTTPSNKTCPKKQEFKTQMTPALITSLASNKLNLPTTPSNKTCPKKQEFKTPMTPAVNKRNTKGETLLHSACIKGDLIKVKELLSQGSNPNTKDNAGWTPLHEACSHGFLDIAVLLLEHGALVDVPGNDNETPLHDAVTSGVVELICVLRKWGASDTIRDLYGRTPRSIADLCQSPAKLHVALNTERDESLKSVKVMEPVQNKIVLIESNLVPEYKKKFEMVAKLLKVKHYNDFSADVTHVIVGCYNGFKQCQRSIKYMMGLASGNWILSQEWLDKCLSVGGPANPDEYEVVGSNSNPNSNAPSRARKNAYKMNPGLFSGCHMYLLGNFAGSYFNKKEIETLIRTGGGITLQREPNPESITEEEKTVPFHADIKGPLAICSHYCIYLDGVNEPILKYDMAHIKSLPISWLLNCIDNYSLLAPSK